MASFFPLVTFSSFLIIFHFLSSQTLADVPLNTPIPPETICKSTPHPYCISVLPHNNANVYDFGRFSVQKSLSQSYKLLKLLENYLRGGSVLPQPAIQALEDCRLLTLSSIDFLSSSLETVNKTSSVLPSLDADDVQTLLSAILTNQQTCYDGLQSLPSSVGSLISDLLIRISNNTQLYSVSLALFTKGWVPKDRNGVPKQPKRHIRFGKGRLNLKMSSQARAIYDSVISHRRRRLLQVGDEEVLVKDIVVVSQDGTGNFTTINAAIAAAPNNSVASSGYFLIYVTAGVYQEYVSIISKKKYLLIIGDGINKTIITGNKSVGDGSTTFNSATLIVEAEGFLGVNITVRNTAGPSKGQAVAVRNGGDMSVFYSCSFDGYQDTLYTHSLRQFYRECDIYGTVDFIFGNAAVVFQNCNIYPRQPNNGQSNLVTAQGRTDPNQNTGSSIHDCTIKPTPDLASSNYTVKTYLGRPWKEYSRTVYMQTCWLAWSGDFALSTLYYAEYNNTGPGSNTANRVTWPGYHVINATVAANFAVSNFLLGDNWVPQTGVPYTGGLI